jgi:uncharacterized protein (DUF1330 family)
MEIKPASFASRIDKQAVRDLKRQPLPSPIDALNLVDLGEDTSYRWYGLLLSPLVLLLGGRPVWVGVHQLSLLGEKQADEIVIVRYPNHRTLLDIMNSPYYRLVNRFRERGVRYFRFSVTHRHVGEKRMERRGLRLVAHFNSRSDTGEKALAEVRSILERDPVRLLYASREVAPLDIFRSLQPTDPNPVKYRETAIFSIDGMESAAAHVGEAARHALEAATDGVSLQIYRGLGTLEAILGRKYPARRNYI